MIILLLVLAYIIYRMKRSHRTESPIEKRMLSALLWKGYKVRTQKWIGKYRVDILLPEHNIVIECDGRAFHSSPAQKKRDRIRDSYISKRGYTVLRFTGSQINGNIEHCLRQIGYKTGKWAG